MDVGEEPKPSNFKKLIGCEKVFNYKQFKNMKLYTSYCIDPEAGY